MIKRAILLTFFVVIVLCCACEKKAIVVNASATGTVVLPLPGKRQVEGTIYKKLQIDGREVAAGTRAEVRETWVLRKRPQEGKTGYRITGFYDVNTQADGLALPAGAADVYFVCEIEGFDRNHPVPSRAFEPDASL